MKRYRLVGELGETVPYYKMGLELVVGRRPRSRARPETPGQEVFLDMKLLDIENTVERASRNASGVRRQLPHGPRRTMSKTLRAAVTGRGRHRPEDAGRHRADQPDRRRSDASRARPYRSPTSCCAAPRSRANAGCDGVVASGLEAGAHPRTSARHRDRDARHPAARRRHRRSGRVARRPEQAIAAGADYVVVGRPITQADDPAAPPEHSCSKSSEALAKRTRTHRASASPASTDGR